MISLLPPDAKRDISAARANTLLIRYNILLLGAFIFLILSIGIVYVYLNTTKASAESTISENQTKAVGFAATEEQARVFRKNLTTARQILDREVNYTKVMLEIADLLPSGVILVSLNLDAATFGTPTTLAAQAKSYDQAIELKDAFSKSSLFSDVHFQSINATEDTQGSPYPVTINMNVTFKKEAIKS